MNPTEKKDDGTLTPSFIQQFVYWNEGNECPDEYLVWAAYGLLSLAVGRRIWMNIENQVWVTCHIYSLLIGPSGNRKTYALDKAVDLMLEALPDTIFSSERESHQGIIKEMEAEENSKPFINELGVEDRYRPYGLFAPELMDYIHIDPIGMVSFLTDIYDRKAYRYKLKNERYLLTNPYFVMVSCTTDEWLTDQLNAKTFAHGYGRRTIAVCGGQFERMKNFYRPEHGLARENCILWLRRIQAVAGPMTMTPEADAAYWSWYLNLKVPDDRFLATWYTSLNMNVLKIACLSSISERLDRVITENHMNLAIALLRDVETKMPMITNRMGRSETMGAGENVLQVLRNNKGLMPEKLLLLKTIREFKDPVEQFRVLSFLKATSQIESTDMKTPAGVVIRVIRLCEQQK